MPYLQSNLLKSEKIIEDTKPHWIVYISVVGYVLLGLFLYCILSSKYIFGQLNTAHHYLMWGVGCVFLLALIEGLRVWIFQFFSQYAIVIISVKL